MQRLLGLPAVLLVPVWYSHVIHTEWVMTLLISLVYAICSGWVLIDYDFFHGDVVISSALSDVFAPTAATDPYTSVGGAVYMVATVMLYVCSAPATHDSSQASKRVHSTTERDESNPYSSPLDLPD